MDRFPPETAHLLAFVVTLTLGFASGCDLPGIPSFVEGRPDAQMEADTSETPVVCQPGERRCVGNAVRVCDPDGGDFQIAACGSGETCATGACQPIQNTCGADQAFALSATEVTFDVSSDFKSQTKQVRLTNCGTSTLVMRSASVRAPERPDGTKVFGLANELGQLEIRPGDSVDITVVYRPAQGLSHVAGRLELSLIADELTNVEVALRSKAICVASTPLMDFGVANRGAAPQRLGTLQNCGTESLTLTGFTAFHGVDVELQEKVEYELRPTEEIRYVARLQTDETGPLDGSIDFEFDDPLVSTSTEINAYVTSPDCVQLGVDEPQLLVNNQPLLPRPNALTRVHFPDAPANILHWVRLVDQPDRSHETFEQVSNGWVIRPRIVGRYRALAVPIDLSTDERGCDVEELAFDVPPSAPMHVELTWTTNGDSIHDDLGFGQGANLDLHVLNTPDGEGAWNDPASDCFPGAESPCGSAEGAVSLSHSGGIPEIATFVSPDQRIFEIGVHMSNPFDFTGARARVRVFADGELITSLGTRSLQAANDFWLVGRWSHEERRWTPIDRSFGGFPK